MLLLVISVIFLCYVFARLSRGINRSSSCLIGKTAIVTGANSGLGYQTALNLASRGCRVIMADVADMEESQTNIIKYTNNSNIYTKKIDLSSLQSVREFAADILKSEERLDILINNAGLGCSKEVKTEDGLHLLMQVNYFGHFLLTHLLTDLLKKSAPSRILFTSSLLAFLNNLSSNNLNYTDKLGTAKEKIHIYANSKLAAIVASDIFAEKLKGTGVTSNSVHPGFVDTPIFQTSFIHYHSDLGKNVIRFLQLPFAKDPWEGSQSIIHAAVSKKLQKVSGKFFSDCRPFFKPLKAYNNEFCEEIWNASEKYVNLLPKEKI